MILMALLPGDLGASHAGGYPAIKDLWDTVKIAFKGREGQLVKGGAYKVTTLDEKALTFTRVETGKLVRITRSKVEKTYARLQSGEVIPFREIDYTVAIEYGVLLCLGNLVETDDAARVYRLGKRS